MAALGTFPLPWLRPLSWVYGFGVGLRNLSFELGIRRVHRLPVPVVSVGNLTAGGTGKTPLVIWLVERLTSAGIRPGVLARGYRREHDRRLNDEGRLLARRFPDLPQAQDPNRHSAGLLLLEEHDVDVVLLDDGFQHRRLHRDLDICLLDATDPFAGGRLLPAGWLREPPVALDRADVIVLTGAQGMARAELDEKVSLVRARTGERPCLSCATVAAEVVEMPGGAVLPVESLAGRRCSLLAGIARPGRFRQTLVDLGAEIRKETLLPDHAKISADFVARLSTWAERDDEWLVLTEKDEARLDLPEGAGPKRHVLRIGLQFTGGEPPLSVFLPPALREKAN